METNTLVSVKQNSKPGQVTIKIHIKTDGKKDTELSKYIWNLTDKSITNYSIKWSIVKQTSGYIIASQLPEIYVCQKNLSLVILETKTA